MIDHATSWIEATPIETTSAADTADAFISTWISRWGVPLHVITDQGSNFESEFFQRVSQLIGFTRLRTTAYHPQTNGKIERAHRTLKQIIRARNEGDWNKSLPLALMAMRMFVNSNGQSPFTLVTGAMFAVPHIYTNDKDFSWQTLMDKLRTVELKCDESNKQTQNNHHKVYIPKELQYCKRVWLRIDRIRRPLESPYTGPHAIVLRDYQRGTFVISYNGKDTTVSINRLKPVIEGSQQPMDPSPIVYTTVETTAVETDTENTEMSDQDDSNAADQFTTPSQPNHQPTPPPDQPIIGTPEADDNVQSQSAAPSQASLQNESPQPATTRSRRHIHFNKNPDYHYY